MAEHLCCGVKFELHIESDMMPMEDGQAIYVSLLPFVSEKIGLGGGWVTIKWAFGFGSGSGGCYLTAVHEGPLIG